MRRLFSVVAVGVLAVATLAFSAPPASSGTGGAVGYTVGTVGTAGGAACAFYSIDLATGAATQISDPSEPVNCADGLTFSPDGTLYAYAMGSTVTPNGATPPNLVTIDLATGAQTVIGPLPPVFVGGGGMTFDAAGNLWLYGVVAPLSTPECLDVGSSCLWKVNPADATTTFVGSVEERTVRGLAATCTEVLAIDSLVVNGLGNPTQISRVDTTTAALELVVEVDEIIVPEGLDFDDAGGLWALSAAQEQGAGLQEINAIDLTTGEVGHTTVTLNGQPVGGFLGGLAISPISCAAPPPAPAPLVIQPTFTG